MIAQTADGGIQAAAIEALKQSPGILAALIVIALFMRYISSRDRNDQEERKSVRETQNNLADSVKTLAVVVEGLKEKLKK